MALGLLAQILRLGLRWSRGAPANVDIAAGLRRLPRAYLRDVHAVVAREPRVARMHALVAGGTLGAALAMLCLALTGWAVFAVLTSIAAIAGIAGALIDARRRLSQRPDRLSGGLFDVLPWALLAFDAGLLLSALAPWAGPGAVWVGALLMAGGGGWLVLRSAAGPMRHAIAGVTTLVTHPRPERFEDRPATALSPAPDGYGIGKTTGFGWNRLAMFDACVQCGKCEAVCPAYAADQPLNPKKLINDLVVGLEAGGIGREYSGHGHPAPTDDRPLDGLIAGFGPDPAPLPVSPDALWSCTTCRACVQACPMMIEHVDAIIDLRRYDTQSRGVPPDAVGATLLDLGETDTLSGRAPKDRYDWAADLNLRVLSEGDACDILLWAGESAFDLRSQATLRALVQLLQRAGVDVAILGGAERDCGDFARRTGDEARFTALARANLATLAQHRIGRIVSADPHVVHCLGREYPTLGALPDALHHTTLLDELVAEGCLDLPQMPGRTVTYHDPCYLGRYMGETEAPRRLLDRLGLKSTEMADHGRFSRCCGGGGGAAVADVPGKRRIPDIRMDQARATGAQTVVAACPTCTQMLEGVPGERPEVLDVAQMLWQAVEDAR